MRHSFLVAASLSVLTGCAPFFGGSNLADPDVMVHTKVIDRSVKLPRICLGGVALLTPFDKIATDHREIALLTASGDVDAVNNTALYQELRREAAWLGANAIIVNKLQESSTLGQFAALKISGNEARWSSATAIYIPADTQRVRLACAARK